MNAASFFTDCQTCQGEGYQLIGEGHADEHAVRCTECGGEGRLEVCASCGDAPKIEAGRELCACTKVQQVAA